MKRHLILALPLWVLGACGGQSTIPEDQYYRLPSPQVQSGSRTLTDGPIYVEQFIADGVQRERPLVYADAAAPTEMRQYHYHFWADSPARLLRDQLVEYLRSTNAGSMVTDSPEVPASLSIYGKIRRLDQVLQSGASQVVVSVEFRVQKAGVDTPILIREYDRTRVPSDKSMEAAVDAFGAALSEIYSQLADDIVAAR